MKVRTKITIILCFVLSVLLAVFTVGYTFAWFANYASISINLYTDDEGGYFDSGSGTESDPYVITNYKHLYNLAWLQNMGKFDGGVYYFELGDNIDMCAGGAYCVIPPIGNDTYPFKGVFNGGGYTISNLVVSTDKSKLSNTDEAHASSYVFSDYVGLFGNTYSGSEITNFILDNPIVEVASENTLYTGASDAQYCGLAIGYVAGKASSIGVIGGYLCVSKGGYSTYNSILGDISDSLTTSVTGGTAGETGSGDLGYGTSTDLKELYTTLSTNSETLDDGTPTVKKGYAFPFRATSQTYYDNVDIDQTATVTLSAGEKSVGIARTQYAASNNIGYYVGSDVKFYNKSFTYDKFYYPNNSSESTVCGTTYPAPSDDIVEYLNNYGTYFMRLTGSEIDISNEGGLVYVESEYGQVGSYTGAVLLPRRCVWVAPIEAGTLKFVCVALDGNMGLRVNKLTRSTPGNYSTYFSSSEQILEFNALLLDGLAYYFEIEVLESDIEAGYEYAITGGNNYKTYLAYVDLGSNGTTTSMDSGGDYSSDYDVSAIDFIYSGVTISQSTFSFEITDGTFVATGTRIYFSAATGDGATIVMGFYRNGSGYYSSDDTSDTTYTITVTYYIVTYSAPTQTRSTATIAAGDIGSVTAPGYGSTYNSS